MNLARFKINGNASTNGGFDVDNSGSVSFALESSSGLIRKAEYWIKSSTDSESPAASKDAPDLLLVGATTGNRVQPVNILSAVTTTVPSSGAHSWIVRCVVNDGVDADGAINSDYWFERILAIRSSSGRRKIVATEGTQYSPRGWADAQNEDVDAVANADSRRWRKTGPIQIDDSFSGTLPLACMSAPYPIPKVGLPVRLCDMQPICYGDTNGNYSGDAVNGALFVGLTGPIYDYADDAGLIYPSMISDGGGSFHVNFYSDAARTKLFGHTASFTAVGTVAFVADNGAELTGTVVIAGTLAASASASLQVYRYGIINGADATTGAINWTWISITNCIGIWIGTPEMVVPLDVSIKGSYAEATSSQALFAHNARKIYWDRPTAHLAYLRAEHGVPAEASQPKIAMVHNGVLVHADADAMTVDTTRGQSNDAFSVDSARRIAFSQPVEMRVQAGTGDAQNLSATAVYILE